MKSASLTEVPVVGLALRAGLSSGFDSLVRRKLALKTQAGSESQPHPLKATNHGD